MTRYALLAPFFGALVLLSLSLAVPAAAEEKKTADDPVSAIVDGEEVLRSDVNEARSRLPEQYQQAPLQTIFGPLRESVIDTKLAAAEARRQNLQNDSEVVTLLARIEDQILEHTYITRQIEQRATDEILQQRYAAMAEGMSAEQEVQASHILVETEAEAQEIIDELAKGADFAELAKKRSKDPGSGANGGDLGFFRKGQMVEPFAAAAFGLEKGSITETPVQTQFGWHVIKVLDSRTAAPPPFEQVAEQLRGELAREIRTNVIEELRGGAVIKRFTIDGAPVEEEKPAEEEKTEEQKKP